MDLENTYDVLIKDEEEKREIQNFENSNVQPLMFVEFPCVVYGQVWNDGSGAVILFYQVDSLEYSNYDKSDVIEIDEFTDKHPNMRQNNLYSIEVLKSSLENL